MDIRFIKDYNGYKKGSIINVCSLKAKSLIKKGIAEIAPEHWCIGDLVVANIIKAKSLSENNKKIADSEFVHKGIFVHLKDRIANLGPIVYFKPDEYLHCLSGDKYNPSEMQECGFFDNGAIGNTFVDVDSVKPFSKFFLNLMIRHGLNKDVYLTREDIKKIELNINKESNQITQEDIK